MKKISISLFSFMLVGCCSFLGLMLLFFAMLLWGFDSPLTGSALLAGMVFLLIGGFVWARKLPWQVALAIGGTTFAAACFAEAYVPLIVSYQGEDMPGFLIHLLNFTLGVPGIAIMLAAVVNIFRSLRSLLDKKEAKRHRSIAAEPSR
ncbi:hypothetical protein PDESU_04424 [Pontiella desulfatans]|uniref:Uncharacterized protein n=1 Tax=Pontiella desulfatans TaxID=2750659 RepID=A0A6C2U7X7_PONDE|nr:hypothetical protein [Pontiella desulfatans]VGO15837.1 hypothetical protein PDESU_04424 [Pontiella desulfatans]